ncbi:hypothetical protein HRbin02_00543 [Candidatus Calditenuaceae archaeon HR02]|nr:hypothetical protein HRbin02_00543 [Candidatus Calditenuaceae archaeon HR02]
MSSILALEIVIVISTLSILSYKLRILDLYGTLLAASIGGIVYLTVGRIGIILLTVFVVVAGIFTKLGYDRKSLVGAAEPRKGLRGWRNVLGNGLVAAAAAVVYTLAPQHSEIILSGYIGAIAAVFADTMATEIGLLQKRDPILIIGLRRVKPGTPGGVSLLGYMGALFSAVILVAAYLFLVGSNPLAPHIVGPAVISASLVGTTVDSVIGQLLQGLYRCEACGKITELSTHCGRMGKLIKGYRLIDNHTVNIICSLSGAVVGATITLLFYSTV